MFLLIKLKLFVPHDIPFCPTHHGSTVRSHDLAKPMSQLSCGTFHLMIMEYPYLAINNYESPNTQSTGAIQPQTTTNDVMRK